MKKITLAAIALVFSVQSAFAEDESTQSPSPWNGSHVGLDGGYAWDPVVAVSAFPALAGIDNQQLAFPGGFYPGITHSGASALSASGTVSPNVGGFIGGVQFGYDHYFGNSIVAGAEADFQGAVVRGRQGFRNAVQTLFFDMGSCLLPIGCTDTAFSFADNAKSINWLGTVRARIGYLLTPNLLVYATGGLAYGGVSADTYIAQIWHSVYPLTSPGAVGHFAGARVGWTLGGGVEWLFSPAWSVKVEYLYYDLGSVNFSSGPLVTAFPVGIIGEPPVVYNVLMPRTDTRFYGDMVRAGVNYHFDLFQASTPLVSQALIQGPKEF